MSDFWGRGRGLIIAKRSLVTTNAQFTSPPRLLVIVDDPEVRMLLIEVFAREGFRVEVATDGAAAILFLEQHEPPAAILLDLLMPGILGSSVLAYLGSTPGLENVPVAIVSSSPHLAPRGYQLFKKPLKFALLLEFARKACHGARLASATTS